MDEQKIREEAWREGAQAAYLHHGSGVRPDNPYTPVVEYTPTYMEVHKALLKTFTEHEIRRYLCERERGIAEYERGMVVNKLESLIYPANAYVGENRRVQSARNDAIHDCLKMVKRMEG
jgi:hypothetical protein